MKKTIETPSYPAVQKSNILPANGRLFFVHGGKEDDK